MRFLLGGLDSTSSGGHGSEGVNCMEGVMAGLSVAIETVDSSFGSKDIAALLLVDLVVTLTGEEGGIFTAGAATFLKLVGEPLDEETLEEDAADEEEEDG